MAGAGDVESGVCEQGALVGEQEFCDGEIVGGSDLEELVRA